MTSSVGKKRVEWIDIARGIAILLVILGHSIFDVKLSYDSYATRLIFAVHMPLFFIVSGYFYRDKEYRTEFIGGIKNLLLPYLTTATFALVAVCVGTIWYHNPIMYSSMTIPRFFLAVLYGFSGGPTHSAGLPAVGATWFLLAMFVAIQLFNFVMKSTSSKPEVVRAGIVLVLAIVGMIINNHIFLPWSTNSALLVQPFLYVGYLLKKNNLVTKISIPTLMISMILWLYSAHIGFLQLSSASMILYLQQFMGALGGAFVIFWISQQIEAHFGFLTKILKTYGSQSIVVFCFHALDLSYIALIGSLDKYVAPHVTNDYLFLLIVFVYRLLLPSLMMVAMPHIKGLRNLFLNRSFPFKFQQK